MTQAKPPTERKRRRQIGTWLFEISVVLVASAVSVLLWWRQGPEALVIFLITLGLLQAPAVTLFEDSALSLADDGAAAALVIGAVIDVFRRRSADLLVGIAVVGMVAALSVVALGRSPDFATGLVQTRQVAFPVGLAFAGYVLRDRISWDSVFRWAVFLAMLAASYALIEWMRGGPLLDPTYYYYEHDGGKFIGLRGGLPPSYVADTANGSIVRSGGPFLNPPSLGFFLAAGVIAALLLGYLWPLSLLALGLAVAFARAGIVISVLTTVGAWAWNLFGKWVSLVLVAAAGSAATLLFMGQGSTASHAAGLVSGFKYALLHPLGQGFGSSGYQAVAARQIANGSGSESLLGLYFVWLGLPALALTAAVLLRLIVTLLRQGVNTAQAWAAISVLLGAAASETASSLSASALLWLVLGATLADHDLRIRGEKEPIWRDLLLIRRLRSVLTRIPR